MWSLINLKRAIKSYPHHNKRAKIAPNEKELYPCTISQKQYSIWSWGLVQLCKMMISWGVFFIFFEIFIFCAVRGGGGGEGGWQKIAQNEKQLHSSCTISQGQYSLWLWVLVHLCKMMISPGIFFIFFWNFDFSSR